MSADADILAAVRQLLLDDIAISDLVNDRIWGVELPRTENASMPRKNIVLSPGGIVPSVGDASYVRIQRMRLDVRVYGEDPYEAMSVSRAVEAFMKAITPVVVHLISHSVLVYNATRSTGPIALIDPDTDWPSVYSSWGVAASEEQIAATVVSS